MNDRPTTTQVFDNQADACRARGWLPGTRLVGDEGYGATVIEITALGRSSVTAVTISHNGVARYGPESNWTLAYRDWQKVESP